MSELFAVTGKPIDQSMSPEIWNGAFSSLGIDAVYFRIAADDITDAIRLCEEVGVRGLNVTAPYKETSLKCLNILDNVARDIGAANALVFDKGKIKGLNTDWVAVDRILKEKGYSDLNGKKVLVIGAGGAARSAIYALKKFKADIVVTNRTEQRAKDVAMSFNVTHKPMHDALNMEYEIVVNCIPAVKNFSANNIVTKLLIDADYGKNLLGNDWLCLQAEVFFRSFFDEEPLEYMRKALTKKRIKKQHIALTGFMGAGKTELGKKLAQDIGYSFVDTDAIIEAREGATISEIFSSKGQAYFRKVEKELLKGVDLSRPTVLATGGGIILDAVNRKYLSNNFNVVWLWSDLKTILSRTDISDRPLFKHNAAELLNSRKPLYAQTCDICVLNSHSAQNEATSIIKRELLTQPKR